MAGHPEPELGTIGVSSSRRMKRPKQMSLRIRVTLETSARSLAFALLALEVLLGLIGPRAGDSFAALRPEPVLVAAALLIASPKAITKLENNNA